MLYDQWSATYDDVHNKTRDLEAQVLRTVIPPSEHFNTIIELGCGTGKNTGYLASLCQQLIAVDQSREMMALARKKSNGLNVRFEEADINSDWTFTQSPADLITCSLILEHISDLNAVFTKAHEQLVQHGRFYVCELHPFKQYTGSKARFETAAGTSFLDCFTHHITDYTSAASRAGLVLESLNEWFDGEQENELPRLISFVFRKA